MLNVIIENVFSDDEIKEIEDVILNNIDSRELVIWNDLNPRKDVSNISKLHSDMGRLLLQDITFSKNIKDKLSAVLNDQGINKKYLTAAYCEYSGKYGRPILSMHRDKGLKETICLDYKLDSNTKWDLVIEGKSYDISKNSAIVFETVGQEHGRPTKQFSTEEYVKVIFFYFV
jgi:hypothetical protein